MWGLYELPLDKKNLLSVWCKTHTHIPGWVKCGDCMKNLLMRKICYQCGVKHTHVSGVVKCRDYMKCLFMKIICNQCGGIKHTHILGMV